MDSPGKKKPEPDRAEEIRRSLTTTYRKPIWNAFIGAIQRYALLSPGDTVAVCVSGGKDSTLLALLMQMLERHSEIPFRTVFLQMDPGYAPETREAIRENARLLGIPLTVFETDVFAQSERAEKSPCYKCARMRRGHLYHKAQELGCNKIALGHHFNDVIETTLLSMFYGSQLQGMMPKLHSRRFPGMELIRPLYCVREKDILAWVRRSGLSFPGCACRSAARAEEEQGLSKRQEIKALLERLRRENPHLEDSIFRSLHAVSLETFPGWKVGGVRHSFLETYEERAKGPEDEKDETEIP